MDFDAGNTSDPATAQACGSDTLEDSGDNNGPMQEAILGASDKSEEAVPTDGQFQSPPSDGEDELQGATAAIVRSAEIPPVKPLEATATVDSVLALQGSFREEHERRQSGEQWTREDREIERRQRRESEMQEGYVQPQQQQLAVPACSQQQLKYRKEVSE